jgi:glycogen debranching enzyme
MRSWGRDSMISLRGLMCSTGRYAYARSVLVATAAMLWNGLLPNLLDSGHNPRYNCRDSCWWFLQAVQDYCCLVPAGTDILRDNVPWLFIDSAPPVFRDTIGLKRSVLAVIVDILEHHLNGVAYREHNAGYNLDRDMRDEGFNVSVGVNPVTGFVQGGHSLNCGTWMDKNGSFTRRALASPPHARSRILHRVRQRWYSSHSPRRLTDRVGGASSVRAPLAGTAAATGRH